MRTGARWASRPRASGLGVFSPRGASAPEARDPWPGYRLAEARRTWDPGAMNMTRIVGLGAAALLVAACQQGAGQAQESEGSTPPPAREAAPAASAAPGDIDGSTVVATWEQGGEKKTLTYAQLREARKAKFLKLDRERYNAIRRELESYVLDQLLEAEAKKAGTTPDKYLETLAEEVPEDEVKKFYETTVARGGKGPPLEQVEGRIRQFLAMKGEVDKVKKEANMQVVLPEPESPVASFELEGRPFKGAEDAKVTIVEFSDFQCPYCAKATEPVDAIAEAFPEDVKIYFLHFPLNFHQQAMPAAKASRCAQKQDKFWEMHDKIFENQKSMSEDDLKTYAKDLGLNMKKFEACMEDPATEAFVKADMSQGTKAGVGGTPSFYVNGKQHQGPPSVEDIRALVEG
jgi:protein-disulfide isomerase